MAGDGDYVLYSSSCMASSTGLSTIDCFDNFVPRDRSAPCFVSDAGSLSSVIVRSMLGTVSFLDLVSGVEAKGDETGRLDGRRELNVWQ